MEPAQILEMARAYGLHGRLYVGRPFSAQVNLIAGEEIKRKALVT